MGANEAWVRVVEALLGMVGSFAWPVVVALFTWWQREALSRAIDRIKSFKAGSTETLLSETRVEAEVEKTEVREQLEAGGVTWSRLGVDWNATSPHWAMTREKPAEAVVAAWRGMTTEVQLLDVDAQAGEAQLSLRTVLARLRDRGIISEDLAGSVESLRGFYYGARVAPGSVTITEARAFVAAAWSVQQTLLALRLADEAQEGGTHVVPL